MTTVGVVVIATGRYASFLPPLVESAVKHVEGLERIFVLSDSAPDHSSPEVLWLPWGHFSWPFPTLLRYRAMTAYSQLLKTVDVLLYVDVDMLFVGSTDVRQCEALFAVHHPGYSSARGVSLPFENRRESSFRVVENEDSRYFCGGVQGGQSGVYLEACKELAQLIEADLANDIVPIWHDESAWNWWCDQHAPSLELSDDYCTPDNRDISRARIVALTKDHDYYRLSETPLWKKILKKIRRR